VKAITSDPAGLNVLARLYKADPTSTTLSKVVDDITKTINDIRPSDSSNSEHDSGEHTTSAVGYDRGSEDSSDIASDDLQEIADGLGSSGSENSDLESWNGFGDSDGGDTAVKSGSPKKASLLERASPPSLSPSPEPNPQTKSSSAKGRATDSTFLPALTMSGYWSGSESEPEEEIDIAPRKNRRGQRARQQLWEKKYGSKAKHLRQTQKQDRNKDWDPKRGARSEDHGPYHRPSGSKGDYLKESNPNYTPISNRLENTRPKPNHRDDGGRLHPSWEAAKKAKEMKQNNQFTGTKITFD
jgi:hypothetical protein